MRLNSIVLFLTAALLLLAESQPGAPGQKIEVSTTNSPIEITGTDGDLVEVMDSSHATVNTTGGRTVVEGEFPGAGGPLKLQVPRRSSIEVTAANGAIRVSGVTGTMRLSTSNGAITVQNAGAAEIHAHTSNGAIRIEVPVGLNANLSARTSNGRIHSDVAVETNHIGANFLEGKIGSGGPEIDLQTSNGAIYLKNGSQQERVSSTFKPGEVR
jgi:DUF4097 and DUF4098 domain-containing protein YvlB